MTGPEHYRKAIEILNAVAETKSAADAIAAAQVHATLALAMAMADVHPTSEWHKAASPPEVTA